MTVSLIQVSNFQVEELVAVCFSIGNGPILLLLYYVIFGQTESVVCVANPYQSCYLLLTGLSTGALTKILSLLR